MKAVLTDQVPGAGWILERKLDGNVLRELEFQPFVMTTGSRGYHAVVPLRRSADHDTVRAFERDLAELLAAREPDRFTTEQRKSKRGRRIIIDVMRNAYAHTAVAPYAVCARRGAPVATPLHWEKLSQRSTRPDRWTLRTVRDRLEREGDPWTDIQGAARTLGPARRRLDEARKE
jgi:bifunctional non-homologous end joining protein LigD